VAVAAQDHSLLRIVAEAQRPYFQLAVMIASPHDADRREVRGVVCMGSPIEQARWDSLVRRESHQSVGPPVDRTVPIWVEPCTTEQLAVGNFQTGTIERVGKIGTKLQLL